MSNANTAKKSSLLIRLLKMIVIFSLIMIVVSLVAIWQIGAWNLVFPNKTHDTVAPTLPTDLAPNSILLFTKTNSFRHTEGIAGGVTLITALAQQHGLGVFHTENGAVFSDSDLSHFRVVVFLNASGDMLSEPQELAFQRWMEAGGGWLGIHAAGDSSHLEWRWYRDNLIGADFTAHVMGPQFQTAKVMLENTAHPALNAIPDLWKHEEEWYSWEKSPRLEGFTILATLDEDSYSPVANFMGSSTDLRMGDHPVVWTNCVGLGRSLYAAMGHKAEAYDQPQVRGIIENALLWLMGPSGDECTAPE